MNNSEPTKSIRKAGIIGGISLLLMAILAGFAMFGIIEPLIVSGDVASTARNILASETSFRIGIICLAIVATLDIVVAWALRIFFKPASKGLSLLAAVFRAIYGGVYLVAIAQLWEAVNLLSSTQYGSAFSPQQIQAQAMMKIDAFNSIWQMGLILFGIHLAILGYMAIKSSYVSKIVGVLLVINGLSYIFDSFGYVLFTDYSLIIGRFTFIGEVSLLVWLLVKSRKVNPQANLKR